MKLIIGLGNPGLEYKNTRHNVGFSMLSAFVAENAVEFQLKDKFHACLAIFGTGDDKVIFAKPTTFYNNVGEAARIISDFYKISPEHVLIVHDELALPFGTIRTRHGGSDAGNNGIKSLNSQLGPDTARLRIGIYNPQRDLMNDADFVLSKFSATEQKELKNIEKQARVIIDGFIAGDFQTTTHH